MDALIIGAGTFVFGLTLGTLCAQRIKDIFAGISRAARAAADAEAKKVLEAAKKGLGYTPVTHVTLPPPVVLPPVSVTPLAPPASQPAAPVVVAPASPPAQAAPAAQPVAEQPAAPAAQAAPTTPAPAAAPAA